MTAVGFGPRIYEYTRGSYEHVEDYNFGRTPDLDTLYELLRKNEYRFHGDGVKQPDYIMLAAEDFRELQALLGRYANPRDVGPHHFRSHGVDFHRSYGVKPGHALVVRLR